jgi:hypothetical protein
MRYTRRALLLFGGGLLLGLLVVSTDLPVVGRLASLAMAAGAALLPVALVVDWLRFAMRPKPKAKPRAKRRAPPRRQTRKR